MDDLFNPAAWAELVRGLDPVEFWLAAAALALGALAAFFFGFRRLRHARLIEDTPTARIRSAPQGRVELDGRGKSMGGYPVRSPLTGQECLWWQYSIERHTGSGRRSRWSTVAKGTSDGLFLIVDDTGECVVNPEGADVVPMLKQQWYGDSETPLGGPETGQLFGSYRYTQELLMAGHPLYALGWFETRGGDYSPADLAHDAGHLLREWKRDRHWLRARFDRNRDGEVDLAEWELARQEARRLAAAAAAEHALAPDVHILMRPPDGRVFLLSGIPPERLAQRFRRTAFLLLAGFLAAGAAVTFALTTRLGG